MRKFIFLPLLLLIAVISVRPQEEPRLKANWTLVTSVKSYHFFIDKNLIKETDKGTLVAFQMRIVRSDTREGQLAKKEDYASISKIIGMVKRRKSPVRFRSIMENRFLPVAVVNDRVIS